VNAASVASFPNTNGALFSISQIYLQKSNL